MRAARAGGRRRRALMLSHLRELETESIHVIREVVAEFTRPVLLYSIGKDSQVLLHLARKAFHPAPLPFPLLHVDTTWKFREMYAFRDRIVRELGLRLVVHRNQRALDEGINPFDHSSQKYTFALKTQALLDALADGGYDAAFGGARRDEEKSRAKERIFSFRARHGKWDPRNQRPELWNLYNGRVEKGESIRVFPLSNWSELDVWRYVQLEGIPVVPLYFAADRPVVDRGGNLIVVDDGRFRLAPGEVPQRRRVRFRTLGCYPLTAAIESDAADVAAIIAEMRRTRRSERQGRLIDHDEEGSMESKKREGYF
jgi:sulfate adenylyltransferase subunit 2